MEINTKSERIKYVVAFFAIIIVASANAGQVVVVSAKSTIAAMTKDQVAQVFLGKSLILPDGNIAVLLDQTEGSSIRDAFYYKSTGKNTAQIKALRARLAFSGSAPPPRLAVDDADVKKTVAETTGAIGYIDEKAVDATVKVVLAID